MFHWLMIVIFSQLLSAHEIGRLLDESMSEKETLELEESETTCRKFLAWNLAEGGVDVKKKLGEVLGLREGEEDA